jgi:hypothetical protein
MRALLMMTAAVGGLAGAAGVVFLILWNDSHFNVAKYECDRARDITLSPNLPGGVHWAEIYLGGWVNEGSVTVNGFPTHQSSAAHSYAKDSDVSAAYVGEMYGSPTVSLKPGIQADCHLRIIYRLKSDLSLLNPLW